MSWDRAPRKNPVHFGNGEFHRFIIGDEGIDLAFFIKRLGAPMSTFVE
jgi:hypothetical protein